jgi:serralysin
MADTFNVTLTGDQETPPNASAANGTGMVTWDAAADTLTYDFTIKGLDFGQVTAMHFHSGDEGVAGPVVFGQLNPAQDPDLQVLMNDDGSWTISGVWDVTDASNVPITDFASVLNSTPAGSDAPLYWNVHTTPFPAGEIRGQLVAQAAPMPDAPPMMDPILPSV